MCGLIAYGLGMECFDKQQFCRQASSGDSSSRLSAMDAPLLVVDAWFREAERAWNILSNHLVMIAWKWHEFKEATLNDELDLWHKAFHDERKEQPIGRHADKFLAKLLGGGMNLSNDAKCARFLEAWFYKSWESDGYDRFLAAWVKYLGRQVCILLSRCSVQWREPQSWQDLTFLARANNQA